MSDAVPAPLPARAVRLGTRRVYILPTRHGTGFAVVLLVMLVGSVNYNNSLGYLLTFLLGAAALVGLLHTWRNLFGLRVSVGVPPPVFAGGRVSLPVFVENPDATPRPGLLGHLRDASAARLAAIRGEAPAGGHLVLHLPLPADRRGRLPLGDVVLASRWPLGLFRAWTVLESGREVLVYPRPLGRRELPPAGRVADAEGGADGAGREDFAGLRDYHAGDSPRHIHWKAVARGQGVPVKQFAGASSAEQVLKLDDAPQADLEARLSQLALWVLEADARQLRFALELPGERVPLGSGEAHRERCLRALALHGLPRDAFPA